MTKGLVIGGNFGEIIVRQKSDELIELGELLVAENADTKMLLQVFDLNYGSQISSQNIELASGLKLEEKNDVQFMDSNIRHYTLAVLKNLITIGKKTKTSKSLPDFFSTVREVKEDDLKFITKPKNPLFFGSLRSGSKTIDVPIYLNGKEVLSHHVLIAAATGKGKSNLVKTMLYDRIDKDYAGILLLDPHDEYYAALKNVSYYSMRAPQGARTLKINLKLLRPQHFDGVSEWTQPQKDCLNAYFKRYGKSWIESIMMDKPIEGNFAEGTIGVVKRRISSLLNLSFTEQQLFCNGVFDLKAGESTVKQVADELEEGKTVVIDTSSFSGQVEILVGSLITREIYARYKRYKVKNQLDDKPVVAVVLEEAPRVLGKEVLEKGPNIFSTIAREGRKFKVGLVAITQLPSLIPRQILANINTKIILGIEMAPERQAIIESAAQDLSKDSRNIAALDKGEAIITSNFARFATPVKVPLFDDFIKEYGKANKSEEKYKKSYVGIGG